MASVNERAEKGRFIAIMRLNGRLGRRKSADSQPVVFSVSSRLGDTLAEALMHQNKNDSSGGSPLSPSLFAVSITKQVWNFNEGA